MDAIRTNLVEIETLAWLLKRASFTAIDISNSLKSQRFPVRHREVAEIVREAFESGAMAAYDYIRSVIDVTIGEGARREHAYLYHHVLCHPDNYTDRSQDAAPPVPAELARDMTDCVAAGSPYVLARPSGRQASYGPRQSRRGANGNRRDGALPIPRRILAALGWVDGNELAVEAEPGRITLHAGSVDSTGVFVRIWGGQRLRICKTKLAFGALSAAAAKIEVDGGSLRIQ